MIVWKRQNYKDNKRLNGKKKKKKAYWLPRATREGKMNNQNPEDF